MLPVYYRLMLLQKHNRYFSYCLMLYIALTLMGQLMSHIYYVRDKVKAGLKGIPRIDDMNILRIYVIQNKSATFSRIMITRYGSPAHFP